MKYIFISGGVISGLGKGITAASIGMLLKCRGVKVTNIKIDMYLNVDAGTIRPQEHGEVFVTEDGMETDQDLGNYERFLDTDLKKENYMTTGQVYKSVIDRERAFGYEGEDVEAVPHVTDEIIERIKRAGKVNEADVVIVELGGTVGEYQNGLFFEASRILKLKEPGKVVHVHVSYLPFIKSIGELKSKPVQQSVQRLNSMGIQPDFLIIRSEKEIDLRRMERLALFCNMGKDYIISNPDLDSIYKVPLYIDKQRIAEKIMKELEIKPGRKRLLRWKKFVKGFEVKNRKIKIGMVGKYFATGSCVLSDSYLCVIEALKQAGSVTGVKIEIDYINAKDVEGKDYKKKLTGYDGIVVPQGWGKRGVEGKLNAVRFAREEKVPYLGLCFGMQMAVIEFGRNVLGLRGANSVEVDSQTKYPVVHIMPDQKKYLKKRQYGGTIRLGAWPCVIEEGSLLEDCYLKYGKDRFKIDKDKRVVEERHRHRYEFNNDFRADYEKEGMKICGTSPDGKLVEAIEIPSHPFFVASQFHPEYKSRPLSVHPMFVAFVKACRKDLF